LRAGQPTWRSVESDANEPGDDEEHRDLATHDESGDPDDGEDRPQSTIGLHRHPDDLPRSAEDQGDHCGTDAIEERLDKRRPPKRDVEGRNDGDDDERRKNEGDRGGAGARNPADVAEPHRKLRGERTGKVCETASPWRYPLA